MARQTSLSKQKIGQLGENLVAYALGERGYSLVARNVRTRFGEIDLIMRNKAVTLFVEVKTRTSRQFGYPEEAVNYKKQLHLSRACLALAPKYARGSDYAIMVIAVELDVAAHTARLKHIWMDG